MVFAEPTACETIALLADNCSGFWKFGLPLQFLAIIIQT